MELRFPVSDIGKYSDRYVKELRLRDRLLTERIITDVFPAYERDGYLTKSGFLTVCAWKTNGSWG